MLTHRRQSRSFFSWLGTQTVDTPQSSALEKGHLVQGIKGHGEIRKVSFAELCPGCELTCST